LTAYYKDIFDYITSASVQIKNSRFSGGSYTTYVNQDYSRVRGLEFEYTTRMGDWFRGNFNGSYSIATGKSSQANEDLYNLQLGLYENIREQPLSFDRPVQLSLNLNLTSKKNQPFFGLGKGILEDYNIFTRIFYESGKRYTRQFFVGYDPASGRPEFVPDYNNPNTETADSWFYVDLNFEKYFDVGVGKLVLSVEIKNLFDRQNSQIINPVTGRAYQYGDATQYPSPVVNDPRYPDLTYPVDPYPYNPARYLNPRTIIFGTEFRF
jgi:outer membrane receptor protein involved in Fe transport